MPAGPYDVGLGIGTSGISLDDISSTTFKMSDKGSLTAQSIQTMAVRLTSVGDEGTSRSGSSKLVSEPPVPSVPEPGTMLLVGAGLAAVGMRRLRRRG